MTYIRRFLPGSPLLFILLCISLAWPAVSPAEETTEKDQEATQASKASSEKSNIFTIEDVVVRGEAANKDLEATSATLLTNDDIANRIFITPLDMVALAPGISIAQYKQGGTAANFIMRGFSGNSHGANTAIFLDGIPLNEGDGYADTNIINPDEIERVEIIKGPSSALYGNYASAGAIGFYTKKRVDRNHLKLHYGEYNTYEANYVGGLSNEDWDQVYAIQTYHTDGYQDNSKWDKQNAAARITRHFTDQLDVRLSLRGFNSDWDAPGYISQAQYDEDPTQAVNKTNGGGKDRAEGRLDMDYQISAESKLLFNVWGYNQEFWRWYAGAVPDSKNSVGNLRNFQRNVYGTGASYNFIGSLARRELSFIVGVDYMVENIERDRWRLFDGSGRETDEEVEVDEDTGEIYRHHYIDYAIDMQTLSLYGQGSYQLLTPLRVILGARYDHFSGDLTDHNENDAEYSMKDQGVVSPKAGLLLTLLNDRLDLFTNYSCGFALLPGFSEEAAFKQEDWDPQERVQYEIGVRGRPTTALSMEIVAFRLETDKDFIQDAAGDYDNVGSTVRDGIEVSVDYTLLDYGYLHADYGYVDAKYDTQVTTSGDFSGNTMRSVPQNIWNAEIGYSPLTGLGGRLRYHYQDGYYLDDANEFESDAWDNIDAQISYRFGQQANYMLALDAVNLLDEKYADYTSGTTNKTYSPALPLSIYATFTVDY